MENTATPQSTTKAVLEIWRDLRTGEVSEVGARERLAALRDSVTPAQWQAAKWAAAAADSHPRV